MGSSSRHSRKRKPEDEDTSEVGRARRERQEREREARESRSRSRSESPQEKRPRKKEREASPKQDGNDEPAESMSIEETNKLRIKLGLAPLDLDDAPKITEYEDGSKLVVEDGFEFKHKAPENWAAKKQQQEIQEKLELAKKKRQLLDKMNRVKGLADSDSDDDGASGWVNKMRQAEEEKKKAAERERVLAEMDENFGIGDIIEKSKAKDPKKPKIKKKAAETGGLVIGHSKEQFMGMQDQILVLGDKSVLDEGDETLINPNMIENEMHAKNVELRKRKNFAKGQEAGVDEFGNQKDMGLLAKYDEELEGAQKEKFRLDEKGCYDLTQDEREAEIKRQLAMTGKEYISLVMPESKVGSDFLTQDEMISFRKPKKGKKDNGRKRGKKGMLKADDLVPDEPSGSNFGSRDRGRRGNGEAEKGEDEKMDTEVKAEAEEYDDDDGKWKKTVQHSVDYDSLRKLAQGTESDEDSEEEFGNADLAGIVINDDAHDELSSILEKTRKLKQKPVKTENDHAQAVQQMMNEHGIKMEIEDEDEVAAGDDQDGVMCIDSTMEYCRSIGENLTYGLAGNREDAIEMDEEEEIKPEIEEEEAEAPVAKYKEEIAVREKTKTKKTKVDRGGWTQAAGPSADAELDSDDERALAEAQDYERDSNSDEEDEDGEYVNVLGKEADVSKGVGAMLKLAAEKGYLNDPNASKQSGQNLDHLRNQAKTQIDGSKYDIDDKHAKKLDRMGTMNRGPVSTFAEKKDYKPDVQISYVDNKGRPMEAKDAYRQLSYKFHGRNPGKKQSEKRSLQRDKREKLLQMNSSDTPLGTLDKQRNKQEQLQTPYLVLSGTGRSDHTSIKKE